MVANKTLQNLSQTLGRHQIAIATPFPSTEHFSGLVGESMIWTAIMAILVSLVAIQLYITARFQMAYGLGALFSLIHDVLIAFAFVIIFRIPIDLTVIAAILTIIGYSLNDTVVVFDRIRELRLHQGHLPLKDIIDRAIAQTMSRTIMTVSTVFVVVVVTLFFGGEGLYGFSATMVIGIITGTYSSIFVAAPTLLLFDRSKSGSIEQQPKEVEATMDPDSQIRPSY
jgi:preprotein translocase subunit SecF